MTSIWLSVQQRGKACVGQPPFWRIGQGFTGYRIAVSNLQRAGVRQGMDNFS